MAGSGVVFSENWMMDDGGGHLFVFVIGAWRLVLCTSCFVLCALCVFTTISTKYKAQYKAQSTKHKVQRSNTVSIQLHPPYEIGKNNTSVRSAVPVCSPNNSAFLIEE